MQRIALVLIAGSFLIGCSYKSAVVLSADLANADENYTVLQSVTKESCANYYFAIDWAHLASNERADILNRDLLKVGWAGAPAFSGKTAVERRALYLALEDIPDATHIVANRTHMSTNGWVMFGIPIFGKRCASVTVKGVKVGDDGTELPPSDEGAS